MTDAQRNAYRRAVAANAAATVCDLGGGRYLVPSQSNRDVYALWTAADGAIHCPCYAGEHGAFCTHKAAVALYVTQVTALAQARQMTKAPRAMQPCLCCWPAGKPEHADLTCRMCNGTGLMPANQSAPAAPRFPARKEVPLL